jgi:hypothetical protein
MLTRYRQYILAVPLFAVLSVADYEIGRSDDVPSDVPQTTQLERATEKDPQHMLAAGRRIFRFDTFGDESYWGDTLKLHKAIEGAELGGVGGGVSPETALAVGLKVDVDALPPAVIEGLKQGRIDLKSPKTTLALLALNSVVGVKGFFNENGTLRSVGIQCAFCHSTVDNSFAPGIGHRLDGWANRDLNVGAIKALAPDLSADASALGIDQAAYRKILRSWGAGHFDAELDLDGKAFRPDGKTSAVLISPAFGLAGVNLHTWIGWGSVTYWNAFVANIDMHGKGNFSDARLSDASQFPLAARAGLDKIRNEPDLVTSKLAALHFYQLAIAAPKPPEGSFNVAAAERGKEVFSGAGKCAGCHVPPLFTEPGWNMHTAQEIGVDDFHAKRGPDKRYRTSPLKGLWTHSAGGFYHDGRFATLAEVVDHYDTHFHLGLIAQEKSDLIQYLMSL